MFANFSSREIETLWGRHSCLPLRRQECLRHRAASRKEAKVCEGLMKIRQIGTKGAFIFT
jgi:hypothetical protein